MHTGTPEQAAVLQREARLLNRLRSLVPHSEVALPGSGRNLADYSAIFSLNTVKDPAEEAALAACERTVIYANPRAGDATAMTRRFTDRSRQPLSRAVAGPENEYVVISRNISVDLARFPLLQFRCRNTVNTVFDIRYRGTTADGREVDAWLETSETDDRQSGGQWLEGQANVAQIAHQAAGQPITRLTHLDVILDDLEPNGQFSLDVDYLRLVSATGDTGWEDSFDTADNWSVHATIEGVPGGKERFAFTLRKEGETTMGHVDLQAVVSSVLPGSLDPTSLRIDPLSSVGVLFAEEYEGTCVPLLLARERACWVNTYTPTDACWEILFRELFGIPLHKGVSFRSYSHSVTRDGVTSATETAATAIPQMELPVVRIRLVAPPELDRPLAHTLPAGYERMKLRVIAGNRAHIPYPDGHCQPPTITLQPGEIVEFDRR